MTEGSRARRLRFYGPNDYASYWQVDDAVELIRGFDEARPFATATDAIESFNAQQFVNAGFLPRTFSDDERAELEGAAAGARSAVARFFTLVDDSNLEELVSDLPFEYHLDLLLLLGNNRAYERCDAARMLQVLAANGVTLGEMLANKKLVTVYDSDLRNALLRDVRGAEHVIRHHFSKDSKHTIHLPRSLNGRDKRTLLQRYIEHPDANFNYVALIETAKIEAATGVDARLKLIAKRRNEKETKEFFVNNAGMKSGCELSISDEQDEPVVESVDGMVVSYSYSRAWLESTTDEPSVLNNFQHLFHFANRNVILTLPSYRSQLGVFERFMMTTGRTDYHIGVDYRVRDMSSTIQTQLVHHFLAQKGIDLESVVGWFFEDYLPAEFGASGFAFTPSASGSSYLEKVRHLFSEMESVVRQFTFFAEDDEIDRELLTISSEAVRFKDIPSRVAGKYLYATDHSEIRGILHALFSDQSTLNYINEDLRADNAAELIIRNKVTYGDFAGHQQPIVDQLIDLGILTSDSSRVQVTDAAQFLILSSLFAHECASYFHLGERGRAAADEMVSRGWLRRESSLLTEEEASYFNYHLNNVEFSNGPALRNKYLHGSQANADDADAHFAVYLVALKLLIALIIKINDDFWLGSADDSKGDSQG
ncbi:hypothetical protein [Microbacterium sp. NPDC077184]|uniref:hypothetical protein n=1 Tax=Microbacterium sp. NPDC077184 TaxID=3154764 RepID=UPI00342438D8